MPKKREPTIVLWLAGISGAIAIAAYAYAFRKHAYGEPSNWGEFGDYIGGVLGTGLAAVTLYLLFRTVELSRATYDEVSEQTRQLKADALARDVQRKLEGTLAEWRRVLAVPFEGVIGWHNGTKHPIDKRAREEVFSNPKIVRYIDNVPQDQRQWFEDHWRGAFGSLESVVGELADYCAEYEALTESYSYTNFYKRRTDLTIRVLARMGVIDAQLAERLAPVVEGRA